MFIIWINDNLSKISGKLERVPWPLPENWHGMAQLWYGIESIGNSHSASSQLSGEFMLFYSIQFIHSQIWLWKRQYLPVMNLTARHCKKYIFNTIKSGHSLFFRASASCSKILNVKSIFNTANIFRANSVFQGKRRVAQKSWTVKIFSIQYIQCILTWGWSV